MNTVERLLGQGKTDSVNTAGRPATWNAADQTFTFHFASSLAASQIPSGGCSNARDRIAADHLFMCLVGIGLTIVSLKKKSLVW